MGIGAAFWSGLGASVLWNSPTTIEDGSLVGTSALTLPYRGLIVGPVKIYQEPIITGGREARVQDKPGFDGGYFYAKELLTDGGTEDPSGDTLTVASVFHIGWPYKKPTDSAQWELLVPGFNEHDLLPDSPSGDPWSDWDKNPVYKTGFMNSWLPTRLPTQYSGHDAAMFIHIQDQVGYWRLWHYSPFAWVGTIPEVIASAAMHAGLSPDNIDQSAFDNAFDAYDLTTGDSPWSALDTEWTIHASRLIGAKVSDFLLECAAHGRDLIFINERGLLSLSSKTRPEFTASGMSIKEDQLIDTIGWSTILTHTFNSVLAGWGAAARQSWEDTDGFAGTRPGSDESSVSFEAQLSGRPEGKWEHSAQNATSVSKFGEMFLKGSKVLSNFRGSIKEILVSHFPFLLSPHVTPASLWEWDEATDGGGMVHVTNWLVSDGKARREPEIRQGPIGFDLGIGDAIEDLEITGDGETIADSIIIERTYNFDTLTIDSVILETPPNT